MIPQNATVIMTGKLELKSVGQILVKQILSNEKMDLMMLHLQVRDVFMSKFAFSENYMINQIV